MPYDLNPATMICMRPSCRMPMSRCICLDRDVRLAETLRRELRDRDAAKRAPRPKFLPGWEGGVLAG